MLPVEPKSLLKFGARMSAVSEAVVAGAGDGRALEASESPRVRTSIPLTAPVRVEGAFRVSASSAAVTLAAVSPAAVPPSVYSLAPSTMPSLTSDTV